MPHSTGPQVAPVEVRSNPSDGSWTNLHGIGWIWMASDEFARNCTDLDGFWTDLVGFGRIPQIHPNLSQSVQRISTRCSLGGEVLSTLLYKVDFIDSSLLLFYFSDCCSAHADAD